MNEVWKDIVGFEGCYMVSNYGNVKSIDCFKTNTLGYKRFIKGRAIQGGLDKDGYRKVLLYTLNQGWRNRRKSFVHRLVLEAFIGVNKKLITRHLDGNPSNNRLDNLIYGTHQENAQDRKLHNRTYHLPKGSENPRACLTKEQALEIISIVGKGTQKRVASAYGVSRVTIYRIWKRKRYV